MDLTKRTEKQLNKVFNDPKKLRKWVDKVYNEMVMKCQEQTEKRIIEYIDIYSITVAYTLRYTCGLGKKRLPEVMKRIQDNLDSFRTGHLSIEDCIQELQEYNIEFNTIVSDTNRIDGGTYNFDR